MKRTTREWVKKAEQDYVLAGPIWSNCPMEKRLRWWVLLPPSFYLLSGSGCGDSNPKKIDQDFRPASTAHIMNQLCTNNSYYDDHKAECDEQWKSEILPMEPAKLLSMVEDPGVQVSIRGNAARELGRLRDKAFVDRLINLLPGKVDVLTLDIIIALGEIGDPKALPVLEKMLKDESWGNGQELGMGKMRIVLQGAIDQLQRAELSKPQSLKDPRPEPGKGTPRATDPKER